MFGVHAAFFVWPGSHHGLGLHARQASQLAADAVDVVHAALHDEGDDGNGAPVVERQALTTEHYGGILRNDAVDFWGQRAVPDEQCYGSYSLFHQVVAFGSDEQNYIYLLMYSGLLPCPSLS